VSTQKSPKTDAEILDIYLSLFDEVDQEMLANDPGGLMREFAIDPDALVARIHAAVKAVLGQTEAQP